MDTLNSHRATAPTPVVSFKVDEGDKTGTVSYTYGGHTYVYREGTGEPGYTKINASMSYPNDPSDMRYVSFRVALNSQIDMTAFISPTDTSVLEYRWDFGDGVIGHGPRVNHKWITRSPETYVRLVATLSNGDKVHCNQLINFS